MGEAVPLRMSVVSLSRCRHATVAAGASVADDARPAVAQPPVTAPSGDVEHTAARPSWDCRACGKPWPCDPAREAMLAEMGRVSLAVFMWINLEEAAGDMPRCPAVELFDRFIAWTH